MGERRRELVILIAGDIVCFVISLYLMLSIRYFAIPNTQLLGDHAGPFLLLSGIWLFIFYIAGLYDKHTVFLKSLLFSRILNTQFMNMLISALLFFVLPLGIAPKVNLVLYFGISVILIAVWRLKLFNYFSPKNLHKAILIADGAEAISLVDEVNNNERYNYSFVRIIDSATVADTKNFEQKLLSLIEKENISIIVANSTEDSMESVMPTVFDLAFLKFEFTFLDFYKVYEDTFDRVPLSALRYDWFISHVLQSKSLVYEAAKRGFDMVVSAVLLMLLGLMMPFIILAMRIEGKGSIFITQDRIGKQNKPVRVHKIRTMTSNDAGSGTWLQEDIQKENVITKVGAILRKTSIDELPQCINILKGEMSLIGPRNDIVGLGNRLAEEIPYYNIRNFVKPGVTGWAQTHQQYMKDNISPQSIEESRDRLSYDLYYVKNRSMMLDIEIALRTLKTLLSRFGIVITLPK